MICLNLLYLKDNIYLNVLESQCLCSLLKRNLSKYSLFLKSVFISITFERKEIGLCIFFSHEVHEVNT
jgi:hypothetical protein